MRNKVYTCIVSLRPANLVYYQSRSPAELLKSSGLTQVSPSVLVELVIFLLLFSFLYPVVLVGGIMFWHYIVHPFVGMCIQICPGRGIFRPALTLVEKNSLLVEFYTKLMCC